MSSPILEARAVTRSFRLPRNSLLGAKPVLHAVRDVTIDVAEGETLGIVGESGSGKTTLAHMLMGLDKPTNGSVHFRGKAISGLSKAELRELRGSMQIIFQDPNASLDPRLKIGAIITEPLRSLHVPGDHQARLVELMDAVGLSKTAIDRYPHEFSGGQRQRIAIARALAPHPKVLIADEPVSALDVSVRAKTLNLLQDLKEQFDLTVVMISHDLSVMHHVCDRVGVMYAGRLMEVGPVEELYDSPEHPYTQTLLDAIPRLYGGSLVPDDLADTPPQTIGEALGCSFADRCTLVETQCRNEIPLLAPLASDPMRSAACHVGLASTRSSGGNQI